MADTATTRNRLRKPEAGANLNIWAPLINEDGGSDRTDEALDGVCAFALSGSKTLTSTNYETDEARMRVLNITGGTGGTVTIPAVEKWYLVRNGASGDVVISNGSNSVALAPGEINAVFTNGTTIYAANSKTYVDASILSASLSASIPLQTGNGGKYLGTDGSVASWTAFTSSIVTTALGYTPTSITGLPGVQSAADIRIGLSLVVGTNVQAYSAVLSTYAGINPSANVQSVLGAADFAAIRTALSLVIGTNVQAYNANLTTYAGIAPSANVQTLLGSANYGAFLASLGAQAALVSGTNIKTVGGASLLGGGDVPLSSYTLIETLATTSGPSVTSAAIPATYSDLLILWRGVSHDDGSEQAFRIELSPDNVTFTTAATATPSVGPSATLYGSTEIPGYRKPAGGIAFLPISHLSSDNTVAPVAVAVPLAWRISAGIARIRISPSAGNFDAGAIDIYGR